MLMLSCLIVAAVISISNLGANTLYHVRLTQITDYYDPEKSGERPGEFIGRGAELLGLHGLVTRDSFKSLMYGIHPVTQAKLVKNAGSKSRTAAWDMCFSPDKSFSVLWALATPAQRLELEAAFNAALATGVTRIEEAALIRVGSDGVKVPASLIISYFIHVAARKPHDPQFHAHAVGHNVGVCEDGRTGAIVSKPFYQQKMMLGALFRCDLAYELGKRFPRMEFRQTDTGFEIVGVPAHVRSHFSSRRQQMADDLGDLGSETASAKAFAALATRQGKDSVPPLALLEKRWRTDAERLGFTLSNVREALYGRSRTRLEKDVVLEESFRASLVTLSEKHSHFGEYDLIRMTADAAVGKGVSGNDVKRFVGSQLETSDRLTLVGKQKGQRHFSTPEILAEERAILKTAAALGTGRSHQLTTAGITAKLSIGSMAAVRDWYRMRKGDGSEQHSALRHLVCDSGQLCILDGQKSERLPILKKATSFWDASGYTVVGTSTSFRATKSLENQTGAPSITLSSLLWRAEKDASLTACAKHAAKQIVRQAAGRYIGLYPWQRRKLLDAKTIVLIDKAEQLSTKDLGALVHHAKRSGAKIVLSGDSDQNQSILRGAPFGRLCSDIPNAKLKRASKPVKQIRSGKSDELLRDLLLAGRLHVGKSRTEAMEKLVSDWHSNGGSRAPAANLIIANSKTEAKRLNELASRKVRSVQDKSVKSIILPSGEKIFEGDRILCQRGNKRYALSAGELGTVLRVSTRLNAIQVRLDSGNTTTIPLANYKHLTRGFAVTTWQSSECANAYLLLGGGYESKQAALMKLSQSHNIYGYVDRADAGEKLARLEKQLSADRSKRLATDSSQQSNQRREMRS